MMNQYCDKGWEDGYRVSGERGGIINFYRGIVLIFLQKIRYLIFLFLIGRKIIFV